MSPTTNFFGHARLADFALEPGTLHLNHGSFGATPRAVLDAQAAWRSQMERNPTRFMSVEVVPALRDAAAAVARLLGGRGQDWVFVDNATTAVNAVAASFPLAAGDEVLTTSLAYPAVVNALRHHAGRAGARVVIADVPVPIAGDDAVAAAVAAALGPRTRLAVLDHVTSESAAVLPVARLAALCREAGAAVLVDGAHAPGMVALDVPAIGADWYTGNAHKWLFAAKGCGLLWCAPDRQAALHPTVISHGLGNGLAAEFDWTGTRDATAWLSVVDAVAYYDRLGGDAVRAWNAGLAAEAAALVAGRLGTDAACPLAMRAAMATVRLPTALTATGANAWALRGWLRDAHAIEAPVVAMADALWVRLSAQVYNATDDYVRLADALATLA
ncbi:MAG: aminotransferase class V-fold PLP-dependent enzyme [Rhodospirillales bacterium]